MSSLRSPISVLVLCVVASASLVPAYAQTTRGGAGDSHDAGNSGNGLQFVPGVLKAIQDARKRENARRKAAAERAREEQQEQAPTDDTVTNTPAVPSIIERPIPQPRQILRPKPRPHRPTMTKPLLVPAAPVIEAPPVIASPPVPAPHFQPVPATPQVVAPLSGPEKQGLLIFIALAAVAAMGAAGYAFRGAFGFAPPPPTARAFADIGSASAPMFEKDGPQISFMIGLPAFTTTSNYPEQAR
jgi:hypothetical protein